MIHSLNFALECLYRPFPPYEQLCWSLCLGLAVSGLHYWESIMHFLLACKGYVEKPAVRLIGPNYIIFLSFLATLRVLFFFSFIIVSWVILCLVVDLVKSDACWSQSVELKFLKISMDIFQQKIFQQNTTTKKWESLRSDKVMCLLACPTAYRFISLLLVLPQCGLSREGIFIFHIQRRYFLYSWSWGSSALFLSPVYLFITEKEEQTLLFHRTPYLTRRWLGVWLWLFKLVS